MPKTKTSTPKLTDTRPRKRKNGANPRRKPQNASTGTAKRRAPGQTKQDLVIQMLRRKYGVTINDIVATTGWQPHTVRGFFSGLVRRKLSLPLVFDVGEDGARRYHITSVAPSKT